MIASEYSESEVCSTTQTVMRALPVLHELSRATRSEVRLGILRGSDVLTLQPRTNRFSERVHAEGLLHGVVPAHAAASGKALLAFSPPGVIDHVIAAGLPAFTSHTITSPDVLRRKLSVIRLSRSRRRATNSSAAKRPSRCRSSTGEAASPPPSNSPSEIWAANGSLPPVRYPLRAAVSRANWPPSFA